MPCLIAAIVVTHNRPELLRRCLQALLSQTHAPDQVFVIDNASNDETPSLFGIGSIFLNDRIVYVRLENNTGGAGGFHAGINTALINGFDWVWVMDDDAYPESGTLAALVQIDPDPLSIYAGTVLAATGDRTELVWPAGHTKSGRAGKPYMRIQELPHIPFTVVNAPFIGMLIHRNLIARIGLPDLDFFVSGDDADYCARAWARGGGVWLVPDAVMRHPRIQRQCLVFAGRQICVLQLPPWRRYYDTRNRLVIAKRYFGWRLWTEALPGTIFRWLVTLLIQPNRKGQSLAFAKGIRDGLLGRLGVRWEPPVCPGNKL